MKIKKICERGDEPCSIKYETEYELHPNSDGTYNLYKIFIYIHTHQNGKTYMAHDSKLLLTKVKDEKEARKYIKSIDQNIINIDMTNEL
jgi:hypothetical protein